MNPDRALRLLDSLGPRSHAWRELEAEILTLVRSPRATCPAPEPASTSDTTTPSEDDASPSSRIRATLPP